MKASESVYLREGNARLLAAALGLPLVVGVVLLGPVRAGVQRTHADLDAARERIESLAQAREALARLDAEKLATAQAFWEGLEQSATSNGAASLPEVMRALAREIEDAGAARASVAPLGRPGENALDPLRASSPDAERSLTLDPYRLRVEIDVDPRRIGPVLNRLAEAAFPLRIERMRIERAGPQVSAELELVYYLVSEAG